MDQKNPLLKWSERHAESRNLREFSPPRIRSGWDHSYLPPKKCKEDYTHANEGKDASTDIFVYNQEMTEDENLIGTPYPVIRESDEPEPVEQVDQFIDQPEQYEQFEQFEQFEQPDQPVEMNGNTDDYPWGWNTSNPNTEMDMSWYDQFEQFFCGEQQQEQQQEQQPTTTEPEKYYQENTDFQNINEQENYPAEESVYSNQLETETPSSQQVLFYQPQEMENGTTSGQVNFYNSDQCIHTYNVINTVEEIHTPEDILINQAHLMCIAGEITEYEESYLQQLILAKDPSVKEALRRYSLGETQSLIQLLHVYDDASDLLTKKDQEYAQYVATAKSDERIQTTNQQNRDMMIEQASIPGNTMIIIPPGENSAFEQMYSSLYNDTSSSATINTVTYDEAMKMNYLPPLFYYNDLLCGMVLKRVTSKKIFKKWNRCVFVVKPSFLQLYRTVMDWKQQGPLYWQTNIHSFMHCSAIERKSYDNLVLYTFELQENPRTTVHSNAAIQGVSFSNSLPSREVAIFGSAYFGIVKELHSKLEEFIKMKVSELAAEQ